MTDDFWEELEAKYIKAGIGEVWDYEGPRNRTIVESLSQVLTGRIELVSPLAIGGSGVAVIVSQTNLGGEHAVLKFPRPVRQSTKEIDEILAKETARLRQLSHHNIIRIIESGEAEYIHCDEPAAVAHFYIMEYLKNPTDIDEVFITPKDPAKPDPHLDVRNVHGLAKMFRDAICGVLHMHREGIAREFDCNGSILRTATWGMAA